MFKQEAAFLFTIILKSSVELHLSSLGSVNPEPDSGLFHRAPLILVKPVFLVHKVVKR